MQSPGTVDSRVIDNSVILLALLVTRNQLRSISIYPPRIKARLLKRINDLIDEYRDPSHGVEFVDPGDIAHEAQ